MPYNLVLQANIDGWRAFSARRRDKAFQDIAPKIWTRDHYRCQYCGYQNKHMQEVVNLDGDYRNNTSKNLVTACTLCAHCLFLGAQDLGHHIILLPNLTQVEISHLCRVLFCTMESQTQYAETAQAIYRNMRKFTAPVDKIFGAEASDMAIFGQSLKDTYQIDAEKYYEVMKSLRLLPNPKSLTKQIEYWSQTVIPQLTAGDLNVSRGF